MSRKRVRVRCRQCGVLGAEDRDDPCPGLCPRCLDQEMTGATWAIWMDRWQRGLTIRRCIENMVLRLEGIGLVPEAVARYRTGAERMLADELAAERAGN